MFFCPIEIEQLQSDTEKTNSLHLPGAKPKHDMKTSIYRNILMNRELNKKMLAVLIDPEKCFGREFASVIAALKATPPDFVFVGGSHVAKSVDSVIHVLKEELTTPVILFPGDASQFSPSADAILYLSLLSGRNPDFLIGQHIKSAIQIRNSGVEIIPTAYILIDGGRVTSVQYISNTRPIPADKKDIVISTAVAGELLGMHMTYLEAGSGALNSVPASLIQALKSQLNGPLIVGGGIRDTDNLGKVFEAGADIVVIGNYLEENPFKISDFVHYTRNLNEVKTI